MRYDSDDALMAKCKAVDFSAESANYDKNLEILKGKLTQINEERCTMKGIKKIRKPFAILVAVIAVLAMSAATFAASPALRDRAIRAVRHDDGSITISMTVDVDDEGTVSGGRIRVTESDGEITIESECGTREMIQIYDAADLCPDDELFGSRYLFSGRPKTGLEAFRVYTADLDELTIDYFVNDGFGVIQVEDYTYFYQMTDDYGAVSGAAVAEADGTVYFVAGCGAREAIWRPDW